MAPYTQLDAKYRKTLGEKHAIDAQITAQNAKATAIKTAYSQLADKPIEHFQPCQWHALIDHAIIGTNQIRFIFRTGKEIKVKL